MRTTHQCPKCRGTRLLAVDSVPDTGEFDHEVRDLHIATIFKGEGFLGNEKRGRAGKLTAMVCRGCGYTELYALEPDKIPVDGRYVREVNGPKR